LQIITRFYIPQHRRCVALTGHDTLAIWTKGCA
jgi:hypothetical protein